MNERASVAIDPKEIEIDYPEEDGNFDMDDDENYEYSEFNGNKNQVEYKEEPLQLINFDNGFQLNQEAMEILNSIEDDIIIVAVVGKARTGKSYLMNLLLDNVGKSKGFKVDSKISSCTKGIWMWGNYRKSLTGNNTKIIFIDSEGTSATDRGTRTYDSRIFALVVLISSLFIYNTTSNIDEHGISELSLAAHLSNAISTNSNIDKDSLLTELAPKFIWVLRDFTLEKVHPETGQEISSKEYLEICLRKKISGKNSNDNNLIRNNIIKFFPERDCVTLVRPVESEKDLQKLNDLPFEKLKSNFKIEFKALKDKIFKETLPKKFSGKKLNGPTLCHLIMEFVNTINSGAIPNINNSWDSVIQKDIKDYFEKALNHYKLKTSNKTKKVYEQYDLVKMLYEHKLESLMIYNKLLQVNADTFTNFSYLNLFNENKILLEEEITKLEEKFSLNNLESSSNVNKDIVKNEFKDINKKTYDNFYSSKLVKEFNEDYINFIEKYERSDNCKGPMKLKILSENLIANEKLILNYFLKTLNKESENKLNKVDKNLREINISLEDLENQNKNLKEINTTTESRVRKTL
jgi:hypothetical protein